MHKRGQRPRAVLLDRRISLQVEELIKSTVPAKYCFHDWRHARDVVAAVRRIIPHHPRLTVRQKRCLLFAALAHDVGFSVTAEGHEAESARIAGELARAHGFADRDVALVQSLIRATAFSHRPRTLCERIIRDADLFHLGTPRQKARSRLFRRELANCGIVFSNSEWHRREADFAAKHRFHLVWLDRERRKDVN